MNFIDHCRRILNFHDKLFIKLIAQIDRDRSFQPVHIPKGPLPAFVERARGK